MTDNPLDRLLRVGTDGAARDVRRGKKHQHPPGWTPGLDTERGFIVTEPLEESPSDWDAILVELLPPGIDPESFEIVDNSVEVRAWDAGDGEGGVRRLYYFKARIRRKEITEDLDLEAIIASAREAQIRSIPPFSGEERAYFVQITDLQAGQADGRGVEGMAEKVLELADIVKADLNMLEFAGRGATQIFVPMTGDLVEGISGWYEMQTFAVELDRRQQVKLVRRLLSELLLSIASYGLPVHVAVVPGNHGENRQNGKAYTSLGDNDDVAVVEQIAEAFALAGIDSVTFSFPAHERLSLTVDVLGHIVGLTHGHIARGGTGVEGRILSWFKSMAAVRDPIGDSDLLFTGHYHHERFQNLVGDTVWVQGGAMCDASSWFAQSAGLVSDPVVMKGTITRDRVIEMILPHRWSRTELETRKVDA